MYTTLETIGIFAISIVGFQIATWTISFIYREIIGPFILSSKINIKELGKWALVTGATDGIGLAYAEYLASVGLNIILISRSMEKLEATAKKLEEEYKIQTKVIEADFSKIDVYKDFEKVLWGYEIGVLVNNVGISYPHPDMFLDLPSREKIYPSMINCNIYSATKMCMLVMPAMVERKRGLVINVSSMAAHIPSPMLTVYSATKAYISKFSADLSAEYEKHGIVIQCILPGYVATKMSKIRKSTWMAPTPKIYVSNTMKYIGVQESSTGYFPHTLMKGTINFIEGWSSNGIRWVIMGMMQKIRARAVKS